MTEAGNTVVDRSQSSPEKRKMTNLETKRCIFCDKMIRESELDQHLTSFHAIDPDGYAQVVEDETIQPRQTNRVRHVGLAAEHVTPTSESLAAHPAEDTNSVLVVDQGQGGEKEIDVLAENWTEQCVWECKACEFRCRSSSTTRAHCVEEHGEKAEAEFETSARAIFRCPQCEKAIKWAHEEITSHIEAEHSSDRLAFFALHKDYIVKNAVEAAHPSQINPVSAGVFVSSLSAPLHIRHGGEKDRDSPKRRVEEVPVPSMSVRAQSGEGKAQKSHNNKTDCDRSLPNVETILSSPVQVQPPSHATIAAEIADQGTATAMPVPPEAAPLSLPTDDPNSEQNRDEPRCEPSLLPSVTASSSEISPVSNPLNSGMSQRTDYGLLPKRVPNGPTKWFDQCLFECTKCGKRQYPIAAMKTHCRQTHGDPTCQKKVADATYRCLFANCRKEMSCDRISIECHIRSGLHKLRNMREYDALFTTDQHVAAVTLLRGETSESAPPPLRVPLLSKQPSPPEAESAGGNEDVRRNTPTSDQTVVKIVALTASPQTPIEAVKSPPSAGGEPVKPKIVGRRPSTGTEHKDVREATVPQLRRRPSMEEGLTFAQTTTAQAEVVADVEECLATLGEAASVKERAIETEQCSPPTEGADSGQRSSSTSEDRGPGVTTEEGTDSSWIEKCEFTCRDCKMTVKRRQQMQLHVNRSDSCDQRSYDTTHKVYHRCRVCDREILNESTSIVSHLSRKHDMKIAHYGDHYIGQKERQASSSLKRKIKPATVKRSVKVLKEEERDDPSKTRWYNRPGRADVHVCRMCRWRVAFDEEALQGHFRRAHGITMEDYTIFFMKHEDEANTKKCPICESPIPREAIESHAVNVHRMPKEKFAHLARSLSKSR